MKMEYFTEKGIQQVKEKYADQIGNKFYFDSTKTKHKLTDIVEQPAGGRDDCYFIKFNSYSGDKTLSLTIDKFMPLNNLKYNFHDFETITTDF